MGLRARRFIWGTSWSRKDPRGLSRLVPVIVQLLTGSSEGGAADCSFCVRLLDTTGLEWRDVDQLVNEAASIFAKAGVEITVVRQSLDTELTADTQPLPRVVILRQMPAGVLSELHRIGGHRTPIMACVLRPNRYRSNATIYLSRSSVEAAAQVGRKTRLSSEILARALGRVLAHELAHLVLGSEHSDNGILKANLTRKDLLDFDCRALRFDQNQVRVLRTAFVTGRFRESVAVAAAIK